jgi:hypothetical protein
MTIGKTLVTLFPYLPPSRKQWSEKYGTASKNPVAGTARTGSLGWVAGTPLWNGALIFDLFKDVAHSQTPGAPAVENRGEGFSFWRIFLVTVGNLNLPIRNASKFTHKLTQQQQQPE